MGETNLIQISTPRLMTLLRKIERTGDSVYSARETPRYIFIQFVGDREETQISKPRKRKANKTTAEPVS